MSHVFANPTTFKSQHLSIHLQTIHLQTHNKYISSNPYSRVMTHKAMNLHKFSQNILSISHRDGHIQNQRWSSFAEWLQPPLTTHCAFSRMQSGSGATRTILMTTSDVTLALLFFLILLFQLLNNQVPFQLIYGISHSHFTKYFDQSTNSLVWALWPPCMEQLAQKLFITLYTIMSKCVCHNGLYFQHSGWK